MRRFINIIFQEAWTLTLALLSVGREKDVKEIDDMYDIYDMAYIEVDVKTNAIGRENVIEVTEIQQMSASIFVSMHARCTKK